MNQLSTKCAVCGQTALVDVYDSINVGINPELKDKVKDGSLFVWECPHCGRANLIRRQTLYHDPEQKLMIWLVPQGVLSASEEAAVEQHLATISASMQSSDNNELSGYVLRRVSDVGSLIEKVNIFDAGLDDVVIEMCKYVTRMELSSGESAREHDADLQAITTAPLKFFRMKGADNEIEFSYPMNGQMHGAAVGFNVYEDCRGIIQRNPSVRPAAGFARIDADWLATVLR